MKPARLPLTQKGIDPRDADLLRDISRTMGPYFTVHAAHEKRAYDLWRRGYLNREQAIYSMSRGGRRVEYRYNYTLTAQGRRELS